LGKRPSAKCSVTGCADILSTQSVVKGSLARSLATKLKLLHATKLKLLHADSAELAELKLLVADALKQSSSLLAR
jgi:hypothetical protein